MYIVYIIVRGKVDGKDVRRSIWHSQLGL